jgi:hypothetical protein
MSKVRTVPGKLSGSLATTLRNQNIHKQKINEGLRMVN